MDQLIYQYYDRIYSHKDYHREVDTILAVYEKSAGSLPKRILDVGCGTGSHAMCFWQKGLEVTGLDPDGQALEMARQKFENHRGNVPLFYCTDVADLEAGQFDMAVALFNVVNYIERMDGLLAFFKAIHRQLNDMGLFIFDCWNGLAAILDLPREKAACIEIGEERIEVSTRPRVSLMDQQVSVHNHVAVSRSGVHQASFPFCYSHTLWTPKCLKDVLHMAGFLRPEVSAWMQPGVAATPETWKIMVTCKKE